MGLTFTIGFVAVAAYRASSACVTRVNKIDGYASPFLFVDDKIFQLIKSPISYLPSHLAPEAVGSFSDTLKVFQNEGLTRKKCRLHKLLRNHMVDVATKTGSRAAHLFERTLCPSRASLLQSRTVSAISAAAGFDGFARILVAVAVCGNLDNAEVNAQNAFGDNQGRVRNADRRHQVERAVNESKVGFTLPKRKKSALVLTADERQFQSSVNRPNADLTFVGVPSQDTVIKGDCARRLKRALGALVEFIGVRDLADTPDYHLCRQARHGSLFGVLPFVKRVLSEGLVCPPPRADAVANGVRGLYGALQGVRLFGGEDQFNLCVKFQSIDIIPAFTQACQCQSDLFGQFLPRINAEGVSFPAYMKGLL